MSNFAKLSISQVGTGTSDPILFKAPKDDFVMLINAYVTGTVTYDIQYTIDDVAIEDCQYVTLGDVDRDANSDDSMYFPVRAIRVDITSGSGTVKLVALYKD